MKTPHLLSATRRIETTIMKTRITSSRIGRWSLLTLTLLTLIWLPSHRAMGQRLRHFDQERDFAPLRFFGNPWDAMMDRSGLSFLPDQTSGPSTWAGGTGNWSNGAMWSPSGVPNSSGADVSIDGGNPVNSVVSLDGAFTVGRLTIDVGDSLGINDSRALFLAGGNFAGDGTIVNNGSITLNSAGNSTDINFNGASSAFINGSGTITLGANANNRIFGQALTIGAGQTIQGGGSIGLNQTTITNNGTFIANNGTMTLDPASAGAFTNNGALQASGGGILQLSGGGGGAFTNTGGTILADGSGSEVQLLYDASVIGGTLNTANGGIIRAGSAGNTFLTDLTNAGTFINSDNSNTHINGTITNTGSITLSTGGNVSRLILDTDSTLTGGGTLTLGGTNAQITGGHLLTNTDNLIQGVGNVGENQTQFLNQAAGVFNANVNGGVLFFDPANVANAFVNQGTLEATNGGTALLTGNAGGAFTNNGTFQALNGSNFTLDGSATLTNLTGTTLTGGTYNVVSTGATSTLTFTGQTITTNAATVSLSGALSVFNAINPLAANQGSFSISNGRNFNTVGALTNSGTVQVGAGSRLAVSGSYSEAASGTLSGAGTISATSLDVAGTVAPGDSGPGTLSVVGDFTLESTTLLAYELGSLVGPNDLINIAGSLVLDGTLNVTALSGFGAGIYDLINYSGTLTDNGLALGSLPAGFTYDIVTTVPGQVDLVVAPVPEPSTWAMLALGGALLCGLMRYRARLS